MAGSDRRIFSCEGVVQGRSKNTPSQTIRYTRTRLTCVTSRLVAINRNAVVALVNTALQQPLQIIPIDLRVGEQVAKHRSHIRLNHPSPLRNPSDPAPVAQNPARGLWEPVRGHDRLRGGEEALPLERLRRSGNYANQLRPSEARLCAFFGRVGWVGLVLLDFLYSTRLPKHG